MANAAVADNVVGLVDAVKEGVGRIRERTLEIGSRVIWIDNIGSLVIVRGAVDPMPYIVGGLLIFAAMLVMQSDAGMALLLFAAGVGLIIYAAQRKVLNGLSIGTSDGRKTLIVSTDEGFLQQTLDLIREKIESGSITLQGTFDIGATHVNSGGGGVVVGRSGVAAAAGADIVHPAPALQPPPAPAPPAPALAPIHEPSGDPLLVARPAPPEPSSFTPVDDEPPKRRGPPIAAVLTAFLVLAGAVGGGYFWWRDQQARAAQAAWDAVPRTDAAALRAYLADDTGRFQEEAETALAELEASRYRAAQQADSAEAFEAFLSDFPESGHALAARGRMAELRTMAAFTRSAPILTSPSDGIVYNHFPRNTLLTWQAMPQATSYLVEVQMMDTRSKQWVEAPEAVRSAIVSSPQYAFNFVGAQPGRWRVRGVNRNGAQSQFSEWRTFEYTR